MKALLVSLATPIPFVSNRANMVPVPNLGHEHVQPLNHYHHGHVCYASE